MYTSVQVDIEEETRDCEGSQNKKVLSVLDALHAQKLSVLSEVLTNRSRSSTVYVGIAMVYPH